MTPPATIAQIRFDIPPSRILGWVIIVKTIFTTAVLFFTTLLSVAWGDLTGRWFGNDGGIYYLRQTGSQLHWYGEAADVQPTWSNVFSGRIQGNRIKGKWTDVPKGRTRGAGDLELVLETDGNELRVVNKTGGFSGSRWTRRATDATGTQSLEPLSPPKNGECIHFDPATLKVRQVKGRWKIVDSRHWIFDFGSDPVAARQSLKVIHHYRMDRACFIGWPDPVFAYMLAKGGSPSGRMSGEDCVAFDPKRVTVSKSQGSWKIVSAGRWLFDFGQNQTEARQALAVIRRYGFNQSCFVGRSNDDFNYLRR
jgi:hypothetical protein